MKVIIDIDENVFTRLFDNGMEDYAIVNDDLFKIAKSIRNGTPLDAVKAEIEKEENIWYHDCEPDNGWKKYDVIRVDTVFDILDNIGKESEVKNESI